MKLSATIIVFLVPFVIANPIADPNEPAVDDGPAGIKAVDAESLFKRQSCTVSGKGGLNGSGTCQNTDYWSCKYTSVPGFCPGPSDYQCCRVIHCSGRYSDWTCRNTYKGCGSGFEFKSGYCPGDASIKCCAPV